MGDALSSNNPPLVLVESPFAGATDEITQANVLFARRCLAHSLSLGEAPFASHLLYTQPGVLDDRIPEERATGIAAGLAWGRAANLSAFYLDRGFSQGMALGLRAAHHEGRALEPRFIGQPSSGILGTFHRALAASLHSARAWSKFLSIYFPECS